MNIIERIKKFFSRETKEETLQIPEKSLSEIQRREFLENNRVDVKDLLNPEICRGEKFIENILIVCGVDPDIAKSPVAREEVKDMFFKIIGADKKLMFDIYQGNKINSDVIKRSAKRLRKAKKEFIDSKIPVEMNDDKIIIDPEGKIIIVGDLRTQEEKQKNEFKKRGIKEISFEEAIRGIRVKEDYHQFIENDNHETLNNDQYSMNIVYDRFGIMISKEAKIIEEFYEGLDVYHYAESKRNSRYPFIIHEKIETRSYEDDSVRSSDQKTIYYTTPSKEYLDLYLLKSAWNPGKLKQGIQIIPEGEDLKEYCHTHKEEFKKVIMDMKDAKNIKFNGIGLPELYKEIVLGCTEIRKDFEEQEL